MNGKIFDAAAKAPKLFVNASAGEGEEYTREPGLQLTKEQIIDLRKYEVLGLSLPVNLHDVGVYLDYGQGESGGAGLTAADFLVTFKKTFEHARRWSPLREKIMLTGTDLKIFAGSILLTGNAIVEIYEDLKVSKYLEEHDINTPEEYLKLKLQNPGLPDLGLPAGDVPELKLYLDDILKKVRDAHVRAENVREELDNFGKDMREDVLPQIKLRLKAVASNTYQKDVKELQDQIDERSKEIDVLNKQYDQMVQEAIKSAAGLNIGGLILAIYTGVKAEGIRKQRNALREEQQRDNQKMAAKSKTLSSLNRVRDDLQELTSVAIDAEVATQNLMLVWNALSLFIGESKKSADLLEDATSLRRFKNQIISIVEPWEQIKTSSDQLLNVFVQADKEYERGRINFSGKVSMFRSFNGSADFDVAKLRASNNELQSNNTTAQMLFERYNYAPGAVQTINNLAVSANTATVDVRLQSQTIAFNLQRSQNKLEEYQEEVKNPDDAEEVREDMEIELKSLLGKLSTETRNFKSVHKNLQSPYSREDSAKLVTTLQDDQAFAEERKGKIDSQLQELEEEVKSVSEAIDLIVKAGIEKIGEEAALSLDSLKSLGLAPPQVQVAMLAMDTLKKLIAGIGEAVNFLQMVAAYNQLRGKVATLKAQSKKCLQDVELAMGRIELLETLDKVDGDRQMFVDEYAKLPAYFEGVLDQFAQIKSKAVEERVDFAIATLPAIGKYLKTLTV
ncbi:binary cytotoxin component [Pseudomonas fluorescens]|uniref:Binary cytotoxin component n=1 Tax=Pseudomonas fluorescens TaxID=294 RepID=A0A448DP80_PSEFL|nr:alpha-xenorhabdolysin family binary toxin subunit A [Pseudomonas fluorescens]VEF08628.1 binary cytotoxin component [Pseudomonas fluorescens]